MKFIFRNFARVYRFDQRVRRRFTKAGMLLLAGLTASGMFGIDTRQSLTYQFFALLAAMLAVSVLASLRLRSGLCVRRLLPEYGTAGEPLEYDIVMENPGTAPETGLWLRDNLSDDLPTYREFRQVRFAGDEKRNWFDRRIGYPRWLWLTQKKRGGKIEETELPMVAPGGKTRVRILFTPLRRGVLEFESVTIARPDPLGIFKALKTIRRHDTLVALPKRYPVPEIRLPGTRRYQRGGVALAGRVGDAEEFVSLRDYRPGDGLRHIHWKSWAKVGKPVIREYQDEFFVRHAMVLDTFPVTADEALFEGAVSVAASIACAKRAQDSLLDLVFVEDEAHCFTLGRGLAREDSMLKILAAVNPCLDKNFSTLADAVAERAGASSGCICVLLAWDEPRQKLVRRLKGLGLPLLVLVVAPPGSPAPAPGPMADEPDCFRVLRVDRLEQDLAAL